MKQLAAEQRPACTAMTDRADASRARSEQGAGCVPATDERRSDAQQVGDLVSVRTLAAALIALAMTASACTDLPSVEDEGCGNFVVNADEDCDGFSDMGENTACAEPGDDNECHFFCDADDGIVCPTGWGCGEDGLCSAPSGEFTEHPDAPYRFRVGDFAIGDLDGDGFNDIVGNDVSTITVRYGTSGGLDTELDLLTQAPTGPLTFAHFDDDDLLDVVVPLAGGLFTLLGTEDQELDPVAYAPFEATQDGALRILPVEAAADIDSEIVLLFDMGMVFLDSTAIVPHSLPGSFTVGNLVGEVPRAYLERDHGNPNSTDVNTEWALAFSGATDVYIYTSSGVQTEMLDTLSVEDYQAVAMPGPIRRGVHFADVNGDGWVDLLASVVGQMSQPQVAVALNDGAGNLESPARVVAAFRRGPQSETWPLAAGDLNGDNIADYVFSDSIAYTALGGPNNDPSQFFPVAFATTNQWVDGILTDTNGDGNVDVATIIEGVDGVDVFINTGQGLFNKFHVDTDDPPDLLRTGDFDGDLILDVAFKENVAASGGQQPNRLSVIFGSPLGAPSDPVSMGTLDLIFDLQPLSQIAGFEGFDLITDLIVLSTSLDGASQSVAILQGSSSRRMLSPFTLEPDAVDGDLPDIPIATVVGQFSDNEDEIPDILAIAQPTLDFFNEDIDPILRRARLWRLPGETGDGSLDALTAEYTDMPDYELFDAGCAVFAAGNLDDDSNPADRDELIGIDNGADCYGGAFSPTGRLLVGRMGDTEPVDIDIVSLPATYSVVRSISLHDLDNDGDLDLLAAFGGEFETNSDGPTDAVTAAAAVVFWNDGGTLDVDSATVLTIPAPQLFDADVIELNGDTIPELAILGTGGVYAAVLDLETRQYGEPVSVFRSMADRTMAIGDLDADGLDDIALTLGSDVMIGVQLGAAPRGFDGAAVEEPTEGGNDE